jgi:hypothetical protein
MRRKDTLAGWRGGGGVNIFEDARHCSVLYIFKYFVDVKEAKLFLKIALVTDSLL